MHECSTHEFLTLRHYATLKGLRILTDAVIFLRPCFSSQALSLVCCAVVSWYVSCRAFHSHCGAKGVWTGGGSQSSTGNVGCSRAGLYCVHKERTGSASLITSQMMFWLFNNGGWGWWISTRFHSFSAKKPAHYYRSKVGGKTILPLLRGWPGKCGPPTKGGL